MMNQVESTEVEGAEVVGVNRKRSRTPSPVSSVVSLPQPSPKKPRLPTLHTGKRKTALESFLAKTGESNKPAVSNSARPTLPASSSSTTLPTSTPITTPEDEIEPEKIMNTVSDATLDPPLEETTPGSEADNRWICPKCKTVFSAPVEMPPSSRAGFVAEQKQEHEDYHFALDLQSGADGDRIVQAEARPMAKVKKKAKKPEGIKAFFTPKPAK